MLCTFHSQYLGREAGRSLSVNSRDTGELSWMVEEEVVLWEKQASTFFTPITNPNNASFHFVCLENYSPSWLSTNVNREWL